MKHSHVLVRGVGWLLLPPLLAVSQQTPEQAQSKQKLVKPGESFNNGDVTVTNDDDSGCTVKVDPAKGSDNPATDSKVSTTGSNNGFSGDVGGIEVGDAVDVGNNAGREPDDPPIDSTDPAKDPVRVTGTGGTVKIGNGSNVTITNNAPPGGASIQGAVAKPALFSGPSRLYDTISNVAYLPMLSSKHRLIAAGMLALCLLAARYGHVLSMDSADGRGLPPPPGTEAGASRFVGSTEGWIGEGTTPLPLESRDYERIPTESTDVTVAGSPAENLREPGRMPFGGDLGPTGRPLIHTENPLLSTDLDRLSEKLKEVTLERDRLLRELDYCRYPETSPMGSFVRLPEAGRLSEDDREWIKGLLESALPVCLAPGDADWMVSLRWEKDHYKEFVRYFGPSRILSAMSPAEIKALREDEQWFQEVFGPYPVEKK
jgi:hypothetical protein